MSQRHWDRFELRVEYVHSNAFEAVENFMDLGRQNLISEFAIRCDDCGTMLPFSVIDPGSYAGLPWNCRTIGKRCPDTPMIYLEPAAFADSFAPGSFVLAPMNIPKSPRETQHLWPAMIDYCPNENSEFCKLGSNGKPTAYFATFVTHGEKHYGGWFEDGALQALDGRRAEYFTGSSDFERAIQECRNNCQHSLPSRLERFSFAAHVKAEVDKQRGLDAETWIECETWRNNCRVELRRAEEEFIADREREEGLGECRIWPSAACKIVYLTSRMQLIREAEAGRKESRLTANQAGLWDWNNDPFQEVRDPDEPASEKTQSSRKRSASSAEEYPAGPTPKKARCKACDGRSIHPTQYP
ncbi:uncharacterized protein LOC100906700 [Galendromus occidentalis]|uniref:Uncharacterized protein LOC100906700 n=1 Tax=Galendromus occidentalis TaxID=34638 RepID=A0AAJ6VXJ7_9ACAR|nr:uncharacterized protein LOC100906700 [Galendromus occidentalis]